MCRAPWCPGTAARERCDVRGEAFAQSAAHCVGRRDREYEGTFSDEVADGTTKDHGGRADHCAAGVRHRVAGDRTSPVTRRCTPRDDCVAPGDVGTRIEGDTWWCHLRRRWQRDGWRRWKPLDGRPL